MRDFIKAIQQSGEIWTGELEKMSLFIDFSQGKKKTFLGMSLRLAVMSIDKEREVCIVWCLMLVYV